MGAYDGQRRDLPAAGWYGSGEAGFRRLFFSWGESEPADVVRIPLARAAAAPLRMLVDTARVRELLRRRERPRRLVDPRGLRASQYGVTYSGLDYYLNRTRYVRTGWTWADQASALNREVVVWAAPDGPILLSGHHRTTAALLRGEAIEAVWAEPAGIGADREPDAAPPGLRVAPLLWVGQCPHPHSRADSPTAAVGLVSRGQRTLVADRATARSVLTMFGADPAWISTVCPRGDVAVGRVTSVTKPAF